MALVFTYESVAVIGAAAALVLFVLIIYWRFFYLKDKKLRAQLLSLHFNAGDFIADCRLSRFDLYNKKWTRLILVPIFAMCGATVLPRFFGLPFPLDFAVTSVGSLLSVVGAVVLSINSREAERARNLNKPFGTAHILFPEQGEQGLTLKRLEIDNEIELSEEQYEVIASQAIEGIKKVKTFEKAGIDEAKIKKDWIERLKKNHVYRARVADKYRILLITESKFATMKTPDTRSLIDETVDVNVQLVPMFLFYAGPTTRIFRTSDNKGKSQFTDRVMGILVDLFDLGKRNEMLLSGDFTAPTKTDALLAEYLHLYEQRSATSTEMTKALRDLEKAKAEIDDKEFDHDAESNRLMTSAKNLLKIVSSLVTVEPMSKKDYIPWLIFLAVGLLVGSVLP